MNDWPGTQESERPQWPGTAEPQEQWPGAGMSDADREIAKVNPSVEGIMSAFGRGAADGWGPERLGLSDESNKWLQDKGVLPKPGEFNVLKSIYDMIIRPAAATLDAASRLPGVYHGAVGEAATAAGLSGDIAGILSGEYFSGNPRAPLLNIERPRLAVPKPFVRPVDIEPIEGSPNPGILRTDAVTAALRQDIAPPSFTAFHGSPYEFEAFDPSKIGTGEGAQAFGRGHYFAESAELAESYKKDLAGPGQQPTRQIFAKHAIEQHGPDAERVLRQQAEEALNQKGLSQDAREFNANNYRDAADLVASGWRPYVEGGVTYQVRIHADLDHFLDWDKPLSEQSEFVREALKSHTETLDRLLSSQNQRVQSYRQDLDEARNTLEAIEQQTESASKQQRLANATDDVRRLEQQLQSAVEIAVKGSDIVGEIKSDQLRQAGIPGIKYLDAGSRDAGEGSRNFVVFDHNIIEITHKNGVEIASANSLIDAILRHTTMREVINNPVVDDSHTVPNSWGGSEPINNPTVYRDHEFPKKLTVDGITFDTAEPAAIHENVEQFAMEAMTKGGMDTATALKVGFWEFGEKAEDAFYRAHGMDPEHVEAALAPYVDRIAGRKAGDVPSDLFRDTYPDSDPRKAAPGPIDKPTPEEVAQGRAIIQKYFEDNPPKTLDLNEARDLGVIGPEKPEPATKDSPSELADRAVPRDLSSAATPEDMRGRLGHKPGEYDERGKEWVSKIDEPDDVRDAIGKIAADHDYFPEARGGVASPASRAAVAEAAGADPAKIDRQYFAEHFDSDGKVRAVIQALRQTAKDFTEASERAVKEPSVENAAAAAEAEMRHTHVLEYTMGLRAESGRTLAAWKDLLRETEHTKARVALKAGEQKTPEGQPGEVPLGTASIVDAAKDVKDKLDKVGKSKAGEGGAEKLGLQNLIDAAKELVGKEDEASAGSAGRAGPLSPEIAGLVGEARKVLKRFGADDNAELERFRKSLELLAAGNGKIDDVVDAARELLKKNEKPEKPGAPKTPSERGRLMGAAKRLVTAADDLPPEAKAPAQMQELMEAARQAVGRLRTQNLGPELTAFRQALRDKDVAAAQAAAKQLIESEAKSAPGQSKPPVEHDVVMAAARRVANADLEKMAKEKQVLPPDIADIVDEAKSAAKELGTAQRSELEKLVDQAEQQAIDMVKTKAVKKPIEAIPPEFQALIDKSQRVVDRFGGIAKGERAALLLARTGRTVAEQEQIARSVAGLTPNQVASVLSKLRTSSEASQPGWFYWLWQQGLISGLITHTKYLAVNTATVFTERVISPTLAAVMGKVRGENVSVMAPLYANVALVHSLPDALTAAGEAFRTGNRVPLESEMRLFERGEESPQTKGAGAAYMKGPSPDWGIWKRVFNNDQLDSAARVLGIPGRSANMIHTFYKVLSERASASTRAYETAFGEGVRGDKFWERYQYHLDNPSDDALRGAVNDAYSGAFMSKLGEKTGAWAHALQSNPIAKWLFPFQHIPWNIERMTVEYSPFAVLGPEMRSAILGRKGAPAQNLAIAKMVVGSSVIGYFVHKALTGEATGDYPTDPKERRQWEMLRKQPNSIQVGGEWVNLERLGPAGNVAHIGASIGSIIRHYDGHDDDALTGAIWAASVAAANQIGNEVGFQTLRNLFDALRDEKSASRFVAWQAGSAVYPSSFLSQNASIIDPYMRKANDLVSGLKYRIPFLRETLPPKLDPLYGEPLPNPGYHSIMREGAVNTDPVKIELDRLGIYPGPPSASIGGVKLPPALYDKYQVIAGASVKAALEGLVKQPGWNDVPAFARAEVLRSTINEVRKASAAAMQAAHPEIVQQGVDNARNRIEGNNPTTTPAEKERYLRLRTDDLQQRARQAPTGALQ